MEGNWGYENGGNKDGRGGMRNDKRSRGGGVRGGVGVRRNMGVPIMGGIRRMVK